MCPFKHFQGGSEGHEGLGAVSGGGQWSVKFDVRDFGGHLETTFRGWSASLATGVRLVIARLGLVCSVVGLLASLVSFRPAEVGRVYRLLVHGWYGSPGHGPTHHSFC